VARQELIVDDLAIRGRREPCRCQPGGEGDVAAGRDGRRGRTQSRTPTSCGTREPPAVQEVRAPSTLGTRLRAFTHGHVRGAAPGSGLARTAGRPAARRRAGGVRGSGLHPPQVSTPIAVPVAAGQRLRRDKSADVRGARDSWPRPWTWSHGSLRPRPWWYAPIASSTPPTWSPPRPATARACR